MLRIDYHYKVFFKIEEDLIYYKNNSEIYYLIYEPFTLLKIRLDIKEFYKKLQKHIEENISFLSQLEMNDFDIVQNFIIEEM